MQWCRLYAEFAWDPKITKMPKSAQLFFIKLLCMKSANLLPAFATDVPQFARERSRVWEKVKPILLKENLIFATEDGKMIDITNWDKRQARSDSSVERVRKYRAKQKAKCNVTETLPVTLPVTLLKRYCNGADKIREDKETTTTTKPPPKISTEFETPKPKSGGDGIFEKSEKKKKQQAKLEELKKEEINILPEDWLVINLSPLEKIEFASEHLARIFRMSKYTSSEVEKFIAMYAFDLFQNKKIKSIKHPINYFFGILHDGPYTCPDHYATPEEIKIKQAEEDERKKQIEQQSLEKANKRLGLAGA